MAAWRESVSAKDTPENPDYDASRAKERHYVSYKADWDEKDPFKSRERRSGGRN